MDALAHLVTWHHFVTWWIRIDTRMYFFRLAQKICSKLWLLFQVMWFVNAHVSVLSVDSLQSNIWDLRIQFRLFWHVDVASGLTVLYSIVSGQIIIREHKFGRGWKDYKDELSFLSLTFILVLFFGESRKIRSTLVKIGNDDEASLDFCHSGANCELYNRLFLIIALLAK